MEDFGKARRYVMSAVWHEASQGEPSGYYDVTLSCGHTMQCSAPFLSAGMLCVSCLKEIHVPGKIRPG
jgi:hypothetical protein